MNSGTLLERALFRALVRLVRDATCEADAGRTLERAGSVVWPPLRAPPAPPKGMRSFERTLADELASSSLSTSTKAAATPPSALMRAARVLAPQFRDAAAAAAGGVAGLGGDEEQRRQQKIDEGFAAIRRANTCVASCGREGGVQSVAVHSIRRSRRRVEICVAICVPLGLSSPRPRTFSWRRATTKSRRVSYLVVLADLRDAGAFTPRRRRGRGAMGAAPHVRDDDDDGQQQRADADDDDDRQLDQPLGLDGHDVRPGGNATTAPRDGGGAAGGRAAAAHDDEDEDGGGGGRANAEEDEATRRLLGALDRVQELGAASAAAVAGGSAGMDAGDASPEEAAHDAGDGADPCYHLGDVLEHKLFGRCVAVAWDRRCLAGGAWLEVVPRDDSVARQDGPP